MRGASPTVFFLWLVASFFVVSVVANIQKHEAAATPLLNIFVVPHTHDDVGWLQTIEGYFDTHIHAVLDTTVAELMKDSTRKFIYVEQAYFTRWWESATDEQRANLRYLLANKQWEFILGGWVMQDECDTTYSADIDQMTQGHQFLLNEFGIKPRIGWQIDPFGATSPTATMFRKMNFDYHVIDRMSYLTKDTMKSEKTMEFHWVPSPSLGQLDPPLSIFTHVLHDNYCHPMLDGFDWEGDEVLNPPVTDANVAERAEVWVAYAKVVSAWYRTNNVKLPWGCDFHFVNATVQFQNMDKIMKYVQAHSQEMGVNMKYAILSEYFDAVTAAGVEFPTVQGGDFTAYADNADSFWSGYITSHAELKHLTRTAEATLRASDSSFSLTRIAHQVEREITFDAVDMLRTAQAEVQHHDGVTGTAKSFVADMYTEHLLTGKVLANNVTETMVGLQMSKQGQPLVPLTHDLASELANLQDGQTIPLVAYNSLGWTRSDWIRIPIGRSDVTVVDAQGKPVAFQVNEAPLAVGADSLPYNLFIQIHLPALGFSTVFVQASASGVFSSEELKQNVGTSSHVDGASQDFSISNDLISLTFCASTGGRLCKFTDLRSGFTTAMNQDLMEYTSYSGLGQDSGAYIFRAVGTAAPTQTVDSTGPVIEVITGSLVSEVYLYFNEYFTEVVRVYNSGGSVLAGGYFEIQHMVGPLPGDREVITRFSTGLNTEQVMYTDDNGYEMLRRDFNPQATQLIPGNYYPTVYQSYVEDEQAGVQFLLVSDRTHGIASLANGQVEVMLHRRLTQDDARGVGEALNDLTVVNVTMRFMVQTPSACAVSRHQQGLLVNFPPDVMVAPASSAAWSSFAQEFTTTFSGLTAPLPDNLHLLSLKALDRDSDINIVRLHHMFAVGEDEHLSQDVTVDLNHMFAGLKIASIVETTLTANEQISSSQSTSVTIKPKDMRTFLVEFM